MEDLVMVPRSAVRFPLELRTPVGFRAEDASTWPDVPGRMEWVGGRLWLMPPCGEVQASVATDATLVVAGWARDRADFVVGSSEAGMKLGDDVRGAECGVWRLDLATAPSSGFARRPPILAVEVTGQDEGEDTLRPKAAWYLAHGVLVVWIVLCDAQEVLVVTPEGERRFARGEQLPEHPALPGLTPGVDRFFVDLNRRLGR